MGGDQHNRAYDGGRGEQHRQKQQGAPEKHAGEKAVLKLVRLGQGQLGSPASTRQYSRKANPIVARDPARVTLPFRTIAIDRGIVE